MDENLSAATRRLAAIGSSLSRSLGRRTSGRELIPEIDGLRAVAIMAVMVYHASGNYSAYYSSNEIDGFERFFVAIFRSGNIGVQLFFVISGFILSLPFAEEKIRASREVDLRRYFTRRLTRLEPPYVLAMSIIFALRCLERNDFDLLPHYLASLFYLHNALFNEGSAITYVAWSLEIEVQFYLTAPLLCLVYRIPDRIVRTLIIVVSMLMCSLVFGGGPPDGGPGHLLHYLSFFLVGLILADLYLIDDPKCPKTSKFADLLAVAGLTLTFLLDATSFYVPLLGPPVLALSFVGVHYGHWVPIVLRWRPFVIVGAACYSIYLWHFVAIGATRPFVYKGLGLSSGLDSRLLYVVAASVVSVSVGLAMFILVEKPTMTPGWPSKLRCHFRAIASKMS